MTTIQSVRFLLVEDSDIPNYFDSAVARQNARWCFVPLPIWSQVAGKTEFSYEYVLQFLARDAVAPSVAAFDLKYENLPAGLALPYWEAIPKTDKAEIPEDFRFGVNAMLRYVDSIKSGDHLIVISSTYAAPRMDVEQPIRSQIEEKVQKTRPKAAVYVHFLTGSLVKNEYQAMERLAEINGVWESIFGSMASRLRASQNAGWFREGAEFPAHMIHAVPGDDLNRDDTKADLCWWLACLSGSDAGAVRGALDGLFATDGFGFYKHAVERVTGACALHCGRGNGKPLNMHGLALIACCYAGDFATVFQAITWPRNDSERLIDSSPVTNEAENLLFSFVGKPTVATQASGVFGILGIHDGRDGGVKGSKTVTSVKLTEQSVEVKFGIKGTELAKKYNGCPTTGTAYSALTALRDSLSASGVTVSCAGSASDFTLTITKP